MLDTVHDVQAAYRQLLTAFSFPGTVQRLATPARPEDNRFEGSGATALLAITLLDNEVSAFFHPASPAEPERIRHLTYTRIAAPETADFLFLGVDPDIDTLRRAKVGTHIDPHLGATILVYVQTLPSTRGGAAAESVQRGYVLTGPGIANASRLTSENRAPTEADPRSTDPLWWVEMRNELCVEYPLGVEVIVYDAETNVMVVPRSTHIAAAPSNGSQGGFRWHT